MCSHTSSVRWCWVVYWRDIKLLCLEKISNEAFQSLWIEISFIKEKSVIFGIVYRQHNSPKRFQQYLDETIEKFAPSGKHVVIMGDFRIDPLQCDSSSYSHNLMSSLQSCYLILTIDKSEFIALLLLSSMISLLAILTKLWPVETYIISDIRDHFSQFCNLKSTKDKVKAYKFNVRNFSKFSADCFNADLSLVDWNAIVETKSCDGNDLFSSFYNKFNKLVNKHAPMKTISNREAKTALQTMDNSRFTHLQ